MSDLKTPFDKAAAPIPDLGGAGVVSRGTDPNISTGGTGALQDVWEAPPVPVPGGGETANPVSGLPTRPNRFEPSGTPPEPPTLQDRSPSTIDKS